MTTPPPPPSYQQSGPPGKTRLRGRIPLRLSLIFGVIGVILVVIGGILLANSALNKIDSFKRVSVAAGSGTVDLTRTGNYVAYYETGSSSSHKAFVQMRLVDSSGSPVSLKLYNNGTTLTYDEGGRHGEALFTFKIAKSGTYQVQVRSDTASAGAKIAFGESVAKGLAVGVGLLIPGVLLVITAIILLIIGLVKRSRHKTALASGYGYPQGPPGPQFGGPQQGQGYPQQGYQQGQGFQQGQGYQQGPGQGQGFDKPGNPQQ